MAGHSAVLWVAMQPGKLRALPDTPDGRLQDLIEVAKAHTRANAEQPFDQVTNSLMPWAL